MAPESLDPLVFGHRLRHYRRQAGLTLEALGGPSIGPRPTSPSWRTAIASPRLSTVNQLAAALDCGPVDLLAAPPPNRRAELEVALAHIQDDPRYQELRLPYLRPSARLDDVALEHVIALFDRVREPRRAPDRPGASRSRGAGLGPPTPPCARICANGTTTSGRSSRQLGGRCSDRLRGAWRRLGAPSDRSGRLLRLHHRPSAGPAGVDPVDQRPSPSHHLRAAAESHRWYALGPLGHRPDAGPLRVGPP